MNVHMTGAESKRITTASGEERVPYEEMLRAVGLYLDDEGAQGFSLLEVTDGMSLRYQRSADSSERAAVQFTWDDLRALNANARQRRGRRAGSRKPAAAEARHKYQDFLRLLGHELEKVPAYTIALDELEDGVLTTYLYLDPAHGYLAKKRLVVVPAHQEEMLLTTARSRRVRTDKRWGIRLFNP
jgi:hypothetical protein